jgi:serine/threonine protein kinase
MTKKGEPKITDWGLSKIASAASSATVRGYTPLYAAPEQIEPKLGKADEKTDVYQFGMIFYELLTDELPFRGEGFAELYSKILNESPPLPSDKNPEAKPADTLIQACLQKAKETRPSITEVRKRLTKILEAKYTQSLTESASLGNTKRAIYYCSELAMVAAKNGDAMQCAKYLADFQLYVSDDLKPDCKRILEEVQNCVQFGLPITEGLIGRIDILVHRARME